MRALVLPIILLMFAIACGKHEADAPTTAEQLVEISGDSVATFSVQDVVGVYHGPYNYWWHHTNPPPGESYSSDSSVIHVTPYSGVPGQENFFRAGEVPFELHPDGRISILFPTSSFSGAFTWVGDTLHLEWENHYFYGVAQISAGSSFNGNRQ